MRDTKKHPTPSNSGSMPHAVHISNPSDVLSASLVSMDKKLSLGMTAKYTDAQVKDPNGLELLKEYQVILKTSSAPSELVKVVGLFGFAVEIPLAQELVQFLTTNEDLLNLDYDLLYTNLRDELSRLQKSDPDAFRTKLNDLLPPATMSEGADIAVRLSEATGQKVGFELIKPTIGPVIPTFSIPLQADQRGISEHSLAKQRALVIERLLYTYTSGPLHEVIDFDAQPVYVKFRSFSFYDEGHKFAAYAASRET
ncbi:MAG: hypothetical protein RIS36_608 [Pseudomonadota bacterium]|jgi:hypothetical protein